METLSLQNFHRFHTRRGEQNLKPYRRHELRKQRTLWKHLLRKKLRKKMMRLLIENWREYNKKYTTSETEGQICEQAGSKKKDFGKARKT
jgi:hypothetical protein